MPLYRVDKRHFNNDEIITPQTTFEGVMNDLQLEVEMSLNNLKPPSVPIRKECLYLFCNLSSALTFCYKYGGYIYGVTIENEDFHWRADMNMLDNIFDVFKITDCNDIRTAIVRRYWKEGAHTFQPCYEYLVRQAKVISIVFKEENAKGIIKSEIDKYGTIEKTPIFNSILNKYHM